MKILFFINHLSDGGAERVTATLINHLCEQNKVDVVLFCDKESSYSTNPTITFKKIIVNNRIKVIRFVRRILKIRKTIKDNSPDIIISFLTHTNSYVLIANLSLKRKIIVSERTTLHRKQSLWHWFSRHILYKFADKVVFVTKSDCKHCSWLNNKTFIHNPLIFPIATNIEGREKNIIAVGWQSRWHIKGFDLLIKAWAKIAPVHPEWKLQFAGNNDDNHISNMAKRYDIDNQVEFLGWTDNIDSILRQKSIYVLSSRNEGFPNSLLEAMSQGCACVAFDCKTGPNEIITNGVSALLVRNGDSGDLAEKLNLLIEDEQLRRRLATNATNDVRRFEKSEIMRQWDELILSTTD